MKKVMRFIKNNVVGFLIGVLFCCVTIVLAESINSNEVLYDNSNSSSSATDVQGAIDDVYNTLDKVGSGYSLIAHAPEGLSTELVAGLYRYQGVEDANNTVDNYICFGTTSKSDCTSNTDAYMYRIIGINTNGQMKLIKKEALNTAYKWNSVTGVQWPNSELFNGLNGEYYLNNTTYIPDGTWSNRIAISEWHYATISNNNAQANIVYDMEMSSNIVSAKIGLMYMHDYYYGLVGGNNCTTNYAACKTSWLHYSNNDSNPPDINELIITLYSNSAPYQVCSAGDVSFIYTTNMIYNHSVRPVFYLNSNQTITSGSGTIIDPYILS